MIRTICIPCTTDLIKCVHWAFNVYDPARCVNPPFILNILDALLTDEYMYVLELSLAGWIGLPLLIIFTITSSYTGTLIGKIWILIQNEFPEYRHHIPDPYPVIGEKTYGRIGK